MPEKKTSERTAPEAEKKAPETAVKP
jgi:hypothetical protein